jgi:flagellar assembly factor FliW
MTGKPVESRGKAGRRHQVWRRGSRRYGGKQEVNIITTRFGLIQASETDILRIPDGLVGFRSFTQFVMIPDPVVTGLSWLQSVTAPELAFGLIAPPLAIADYRVELRPGDRAALELDEERSALVYVILNRAEGGCLTVNLQGPLVFNVARRLGRQLVLTSSRYAVRFPLSGQAPIPSLLPAMSPLRATA